MKTISFKKGEKNFTFQVVIVESDGYTPEDISGKIPTLQVSEQLTSDTVLYSRQGTVTSGSGGATQFLIEETLCSFVGKHVAEVWLDEGIERVKSRTFGLEVKEAVG